MTSQGPGGHACSPSSTGPRPSITCGTCHQEQLAVIPVKRAQCKLHHPEGSTRTSDADRLSGLCYFLSEIFITRHTNTFQVGLLWGASVRQFYSIQDTARRAKDLIKGGIKCGDKSASVVYLRCNTRDQSLTRQQTDLEPELHNSIIS